MKCGTEVHLVRVTTGRVSITSARLVNWGSTQVNSTGVPWVMYWGLYTFTEVRTDHAILRVATNGK